MCFAKLGAVIKDVGLPFKRGLRAEPVPTGDGEGINGCLGTV